MEFLIIACIAVYAALIGFVMIQVNRMKETILEQGKGQGLAESYFIEPPIYMSAFWIGAASLIMVRYIPGLLQSGSLLLLSMDVLFIVFCQGLTVYISYRYMNTYVLLFDDRVYSKRGSKETVIGYDEIEDIKVINNSRFDITAKGNKHKFNQPIAKHLEMMVEIQKQVNRYRD